MEIIIHLTEEVQSMNTRMIPMKEMVKAPILLQITEKTTSVHLTIEIPSLPTSIENPDTIHVIKELTLKTTNHQKRAALNTSSMIQILKMGDIKVLILLPVTKNRTIIQVIRNILVLLEIIRIHNLGHLVTMSSFLWELMSGKHPKQSLFLKRITERKEIRRGKYRFSYLIV